MAKKHLLLKPHPVNKNPDAWWYEEGRGVNVHVAPSKTHTAFTISWQSIRAALRRKDREADRG